MAAHQPGYRSFRTDLPFTDHCPGLPADQKYLWHVSSQHLALMLVWERLAPSLQLSHRRVTPARRNPTTSSMESNHPSSGASLGTILEQCRTKTAGKSERVEAMEITDSANNFHFDLMLPRCSGDMAHSTVSMARK